MGKRHLMRPVSGIKKNHNKGIVLLSGGMDSAVTLYLAKKNGYELSALIFEYNQRHKKEIEFAKKLAALNRIPFQLISLRLPWSSSSLTARSVKVPFNRDLSKKEVPSTYVPGRNLIFLSFAVSYAESSGASSIFIGAHTHDYSNYPDCRPEFLDSFERTSDLAIHKKGIKVIAPLIDKNKKEIIETGIDLKVPFHLTWSCYKGGVKPCGRCDSCRFRIEAFGQLGMGDPLMKRAPGQFQSC